MADKSRSLYRGLLIPDGDLSRIWTAESTIDSAGNRAGVPLTSSKTEMVLEAEGHQIDTGDGKSLQVQTLRVGYPGPGQAGFCWRQTGGAAQNFRGWDVPAVISSWENVDFNSAVNYNLHPDLVNITRTDGTDYMLTVYEFVSGSNISVAIRKRSGDVWGAQNIVYTEGGFIATRYLYPTILVLPTGRVLIFHAVYDHAQGLTQVQMTYSDDEGTTWTVGGAYTLETTIPISTQTVYRFKAGYKDGQILLLAWVKDTTTTNTDLIVQFASDDLGASFAKILTFSGADNANSGALPDVTVSGGLFVVGWVTKDGLRPAVNRLGSAYQPLTPTTPFIPEVVDPVADLVGPNMSGELSIATDEDGVIYIFVTQEPSTQGVAIVLRSYDGAVSWASMGVGGAATSSYGRWWGSNEPSSGFPQIQPLEYTAEFHRGRAVVVHRYLNNANQATLGKNSLCFFYLGGYSSVSLPGLELFRRDSLRVGLPTTWVPFSIPQDDGTWTAVTVGAPTVENVVTPGRLQLTVPAGSSNFYQVSPAEGTGNNQVVFTDGFIGRFSCEVIAAPSTQEMRARIWTALPAPTHGDLAIVISDTVVNVLDGNSLAVLGTRPNAPGTRIQIFWALRGISVLDSPTSAECAVWIREWNTNEDRVWDLIYQGPLSLVAGGTTSYVQWGDVTAATVSTQFWDGFQVCYGKQTTALTLPFVGYQLAQGQINPEQLFPRNYTATPLFIDSDTRVSCTDGPTFEVDSYAINVRHLQGSENIFASVSPSPQKLWRSKTAVAGASIAFQRNENSLDAWAANDFYAIHFENVNFKRAQLQYKIGGAWVNIISISFFKEFEFTRNGHTIRPAGDDAGSFYGYYNEFKGLKFEFNPDSILASTVATILRNSEGLAYEGTTAKPTTIFLDPDTFNSASEPASGVAHIWFKNMTVLVPRSETPFEGVRLQICNTGTRPPEGYYEAGQIVPGSVAVFGWDYSQERNVTNTPNVELTTLRDGTRHSYKAGEARRRVRFSWAQGVDVTQLREEWGGATDPDYVKIAGTGTPAALRNDGELLMWGLLDRIDGPGLPVVYIPKIDFSEAGTATFDPRQYARGAIYGRTITPITLETSVGSEELTEVYRLNSVTIEEEL